MDTLPHEQSDLEGGSLTCWKPVETVESVTYGHDMIRKNSSTWTQKLSDQLNLAHVDIKNEKEETKTNKRQCPLSSVQVQDP